MRDASGIALGHCAAATLLYSSLFTFHLPLFTPHSHMRLLFVCMGNICRSPAAEGVMLAELAKAGLSDTVTVDSAGTLDYHVGKLADHRMRQASTRRSLELLHRARQVRKEDLSEFDLILPMDLDNLGELHRLDPKGEYRDKVRLFTTFCTTHTETEVPDPYYGESDGFELVLDILQDGCAEIARQIKAGKFGVATSRPVPR